MLIQFGSLVTQGAGKIGGHVVQRGSFGQIMRTKTSPVVRRSTAESAPRSVISSNASEWRQMAQVRRDTWDVYASGLTRYNKFGVAYTPTGYQIFNEFNARSAFYNSTQHFSDCPIPFPFPALGAFSLVSNAGLGSLTLGWGYLSGDVSWLVNASYYQLQSLGASVPRGSYRYSLDQADVSAGSMDLSVSFDKRFGTVPAGQSQVAVHVSIIDSSSGAAAPDLWVMSPYV